MGVKPGPEFDRILSRIFALQLDGKIKSHPQLMKEMRELAGIKEPPPPPPTPAPKKGKETPTRTPGGPSSQEGQGIGITCTSSQGQGDHRSRSDRPAGCGCQARQEAEEAVKGQLRNWAIGPSGDGVTG